eukprot:57787-Amphidinium_carterae.1
MAKLRNLNLTDNIPHIVLRYLGAFEGGMQLFRNETKCPVPAMKNSSIQMTSSWAFTVGPQSGAQSRGHLCVRPDLPGSALSAAYTAPCSIHDIVLLAEGCHGQEVRGPLESPEPSGVGKQKT